MEANARFAKLELEQELLFERFGRASDEKGEKENGGEHTDEGPSLSYFAGCNSLESVNKRCRDLAKVYHPDAGNGDEESFKALQAEYEKLREKYG